MTSVKADFVSLPLSVLRYPQTVSDIARYWSLVEGSGSVKFDAVLDEFYLHHDGWLFDYRDLPLDISGLSPTQLWGARSLQRLPSLAVFRGREAVELMELFGEDPARTMNRLTEFANRRPQQALSIAMVPRIMFLEFAMRIREQRLAQA